MLYPDNELASQFVPFLFQMILKPCIVWLVIEATHLGRSLSLSEACLSYGGHLKGNKPENNGELKTLETCKQILQIETGIFEKCENHVFQRCEQQCRKMIKTCEQNVNMLTKTRKALV